MEYIVKEVISKNWKDIEKKKNVVGFSGKLQPKISAGITYPERKCFRIYVEKKCFAYELKAKDLIPRTLKIYGNRAVETDIIEIGKIVSLDKKERIRPIITGISMCHEECTACTAGAFFKDNETGEILIASNNHCFALTNKANIGDSIIQPSSYDNGSSPEDEVGKLKKYVEINFDTFTCPFRNIFVKIKRFFLGPRDLSNKVDVAFASISVPYKVEVYSLGNIKGKTIFKEGDLVQKVGRTTGHTREGVIIDTEWNGSVNYGRGVAFFSDCYLIQKEGFSDGGDSGSSILNMNGYLGSLLFAGSSSSTIGCKVENIEEKAEVELLISEEGDKK